MAQDKIQIQILADGTIKIITDQVSMPNHASAEEFLRIMTDMAGGEQKRARKAGGHGHHHGHGHDHVHHGHDEHGHSHD